MPLHGRMKSEDRTCPTCGRQSFAMGMCWRLTCPDNGAKESFEVIMGTYERAKRESAELGRRVQRDPFAGARAGDLFDYVAARDDDALEQWIGDR